MSVIRTNDLNIATVSFTDIKPNKAKKPAAYIVKSDDKKTFLIESPPLVASFGLSCYDPAKDTPASDPKNFTYSIPLRVDFKPDDEPTEGESEDVKSQRVFMNFIKGLDEMAIEYIMAHSNEILKKKTASREVVSALYSPIVKNVPGKDGTIYPDRINIKLSGNEDNSGPNGDYLFFKDTSRPLEISNWSELESLIPKGSRVKVILQPRIVLMPGKFFLKLQLMQMKVPNVQRAARITGYAFSEPPVEDASETVVAVAKKDETHAADSDAEEVVEEE